MSKFNVHLYLSAGVSFKGIKARSVKQARLVAEGMLRDLSLTQDSAEVPEIKVVVFPNLNPNKVPSYCEVETVDREGKTSLVFRGPSH